MYLHTTNNIGLIFCDGKFLQARLSEDDVHLLSSQMLWPFVVFVVAKYQPHYDHFCALISGEKQFIKEHASSDIHDDCCICHAHHRKAKRHQSHPEHIPTWKRGDHGSQHITTRTLLECHTTPLTEKIIASSDETQATFHETLHTHHSVELCNTLPAVVPTDTHTIHVLGVE